MSRRLEERRDIKYTGKLCNILKALKGARPYLRIGQIISNAIGDNDIFYIEDDELVHRMLEFNAGNRKRPF